MEIGPVACSALLKACAHNRDLTSALHLFDRMIKRRMPLNRYSYNCLIHL
jgi:pentatricopeptide repeat protein